MTDKQQSPENESDAERQANEFMDGYCHGKDSAFSRLRKVINRWRAEASRLDREAADLSRSWPDADAVRDAARRMAEARLKMAMAGELERTLEADHGRN